jgi:hypothetical protein
LEGHTWFDSLRCNKDDHHPSLKKEESQGCQMVHFKTKTPNLGTFCRAIEWKMLLYFNTIWDIYGHLVYLVVIGYFFPFNLLYQEKIWQP